MAEFEFYNELIGEQLSAVTFVQDYFQLWFDGPGINVMNPTTVQSGQASSKSWDSEFRNMLCFQITKIVERFEIKDRESFSIIFEDYSTITVSIFPDDYTGPEAVYIHGLRSTEVPFTSI